MTATGASSSIAFDFRNPQSFWTLDNVAVTAAVPEPPVTMLLGAGLLLLARSFKGRAKSQRATGALPA